MCNVYNSYKRFKRLHKLINGIKTIETKLGKRCVTSCRNKEKGTIIITYYDKDSTVLFSVRSSKNAFSVLEKKITNKDMFDALYEAEQLLSGVGHDSVAFEHMWANWYRG